jgi:uncharacterized protein YifE (UPF0438 family)
MPDDVLTEHEQRLIDRHLTFYRALMSGNRVLGTAAQKHFVEAIAGTVVPATDHELAFIKFVRIGKAIQAARAQERAAERAERDSRIEEEPGMRNYPSRLDKALSNAKWTSKEDHR